MIKTRDENFFYTHLENCIRESKNLRNLKAFGESFVYGLLNLSSNAGNMDDPFTPYFHDGSPTVQILRNAFLIENTNLPMRLFKNMSDCHTTINIQMETACQNDEQYRWIDEWETCKKMRCYFRFYRDENSILSSHNMLESIYGNIDDPEESFYAIDVVISSLENNSYCMNITFVKQYKLNENTPISDFDEEKNEKPDSTTEHIHIDTEIDNLITKLFDEIESFTQAVWESNKSLMNIWIL